MADRRTTGGYPKIATVISADLPALGRLPIGARISFEPVTMEVAQDLRRAMFLEIDRIPDRVMSIGRADVAASLLHRNLISGVVDARNSIM